MKHSSRGLAVALLAVALFASGCASIQQPEGWAAPIAIDDNLLVQSDSGQLSLVDPRTGNVRWRYPDEGDRTRSFYATPIEDGGSLYLADYSGRVIRLDPGAGQPSEAWSLGLEARVVATPLLRGDRLYVPTVDGRIAVLDSATGARIDEIHTADRRIWGSPAANSNTLFIGDLDSGVTVALDLGNGDVRWEQEISGPTAADLALDGELLLVGAFDQHLHALDITAAGEERWSFQGIGWFMARPLVRSGTVYAATMRGHVYAIDRESGRQQWVFTADGAEFRAAPVMVGNSLIVTARDGRVFAVDAGSGSLQWEQDAVRDGNVNADVLVNGSSIYIVTSKHDLVRVDASRDGAVQDVTLAADR